MNAVLEPALFQRMSGLFRLAHSATQATAESSDPWRDAIPIDVLRNHAGLTNADLRWLIAERFVEHRIETTRDGARRRTFRKSPALNVTGPTCFVASPRGLDVARRLCLAIQERAAANELKPNWDSETGDWTFDGRLIKHLRHDADTQRAVLDQSQREGWAKEIQSPFIDMSPIERCHYLSQVLNHLNAAQKEAKVKLSSCKKGRSIRWTVVA